jgi:uncharacterized Zn-binding protein involved in type VI secretion
MSEVLNMRRFDILKGDATDAGGTVEGGNGHDRLQHREQAYEGDRVWCPACNTMGQIVCTGSRTPLKGPDGREAALSDDLCACRCDPSPRLVPSQSSSYDDIR